MPREDGYEARIMPSAGAQQPLPTAETYGAGIGRAIAQTGDEIHQRQLRAYQLERGQRADQELSDFSHKYALHQQNMDGIVQQLRANPTRADYGEHVQQALAADDSAREGLLAGITEESVLQRAQQQIDGYRTRLSGQEGEFAQAQRIAKTRTDAGATLDIQVNRLRRAQSPEEWGAAVGEWEDYVDGLDLITPDQKAQMKVHGRQSLTASTLNGVIDRSPATALKMLDDGRFDDFLDPQQVEQLRSGAQVEIRRLDAATAHAANLQWAQTREQIATVKEKNGQGIDVSADLPGLIQAAAQHGDTSTVAELQGIARDSTFAKVYGQLPPVARDQELGRLRAIPEARRSENDQAAIKWLADKKGSLDGSFDADPVGFAAAHAPDGQGPPAITEFSSQELAQRETWMRGAQSAYGSMQPLSKAEAGVLQERAEAGDGGYRQVLGTVSSFSPAVAAQAMRQILPNDRFAQQLVTLGPDSQKRALDGRAALKANSAILNVAKDDTDMKSAVAGVRAGLQRAMMNAPGMQRNGVLDVADAIAADSLVRQGKTSEQMSSSMMAWAIDRALGAQGEGAAKKGGLGWWNGQIYILPDGVNQGTFESHVSKMAPGKEPVNPDGTPFNIRTARPVYMGRGRYQFMIGNNIVLGRDGKPWTRTVVAK